MPTAATRTIQEEEERRRRMQQIALELRGKGHPDEAISYVLWNTGAKQQEIDSLMGEMKKYGGETSQGTKISGSAQVTSGTAQELGDSKAATSMLDDLETSINENQNILGPVEGRLRGLNPYDKESQSFQSKVNATKQIVGKYLEGGVLRLEDEKKYEKILPQIKDTPEVAREKLATVRKLINDKYAAQVETLGKSGFNVSDLSTEEKKQPVQNQITDINKAKAWLEQNSDDPRAELARQEIAKYEGQQSQQTTKSFATAEKPKEDSIKEDSIWGDIQEGFGNIVSSAERRADKVGEIRGTDSNLFQKAKWIFGQGAGLGADIIAEAGLTAGKAALTQEGEDAIARAFQGASGKVLDMKTVQGMMEAYEKLKETNPEAARDLEAFLNVVDLATSFTGAGLGTKYTGKLMSKAAVTTAKTTGKVASGAAKVVGGTGKYGVAGFTGFTRKTINTILEHQDAFTPEELASANEQSIFNKLSDGIDLKIDDLKETGRAYNPIRESNDFVTIDRDFIESILRDNFRLDIKDGIAVPSTKSVTRNAADVRAIQNFLDNWGGKEVLGADEFLNMRSDLAELAKYDKISGKSSASESIAKKLREQLNTKYRDQLNGLGELDDQYAKQVDELSDFKQQLFNKDGSPKQNAMAIIEGLYEGKKPDALKKLKAIEQIVPGIAEDVNILRAIKDIKYAGNQKVGTYMKTALGGGVGLAVAGPAGALFGMLATSPSLTVPIIRAYAKIKNISGNITEGIISKMKSGTQLLDKEYKILDNAVQDASKKLEGRIKGIRPGMNMQESGAKKQMIRDGITETIRKLNQYKSAGNKRGIRYMEAQLVKLNKELDDALGFSER